MNKNSTNPTRTQPDATAPIDNSRPWHSTVDGALSSWGETYNPKSPAAAEIWAAHRDQLEPWIGAAPAAGITEARRIASAVLELVAWAMPRLNNLDASLTEETLQQFLVANPTGLGDGALANVRGRVRRVLRARAELAVSSQDSTPSAQDECQIENASPVDPSEPTSHPDARPNRAYDERSWTSLVRAAKSDERLRVLLTTPWVPPTVERWQAARAAPWTDLGAPLETFSASTRSATER